MTRKSVADDQFGRLSRRLAELARRVDEGSLEFELTMRAVQLLIEGRRLVTADEAMVLPTGASPYRGGSDNGASQPSIVVVPDLSFADLVVKVEAAFEAKGIRLTYLNEAYRTWDHTQYRVEQGEGARFIEVRGERYEVLTWKPGGYKTTQQVRDHFASLPDGPADGNTDAFLVWVMESAPMGYHVSIPSDDALLWRGSGSRRLYAPYFCRDGGRRILHLRGVDDGWGGHWVVVAFRKLPRQ